MKSGMLVLILLTVGAIAQELPDEARKLVEARDRGVRRVQLAYLMELQALAARYRKSNEPEKEKAVAELIAKAEKVEEEKENEGVLKPLMGTWRRSTDNTVWKFDSTKGGTFRGKESFTMTYDPEKSQVVVTAASGWVNTLAFTDDENVMSGSWEKDGRKTFELTREK
jgi:hypothetical protein